MEILNLSAATIPIIERILKATKVSLDFAKRRVVMDKTAKLLFEWINGCTQVVREQNVLYA